MAQASSFEQPELTATAAGEQYVLVADATSGVVLVDDEDRFQLVRSPGVDDVAAGQHAFTLADGTLTAYGRSGGRVWQTDAVSGPTEIVADPTDDRLLVATKTGTLVTLDGATGDERDRRPLPHADAPDDPKIAAYDGRTLVANWSSFTLVGEATVERLPGAVRAAGLVGETAVVGLKNGSLVGYAGDEQLWRIDETTDWLATAGRDRLACVMGSETEAIDPDGTRRPVPAVPADGSHVVSADGRLLCQIDDDTARVFRATGDPASAVSLESPAQLPDGTSSARLTIHNDGESLAEVTGRITGEKIDLVERTVNVGLPAGDQQLIDVGIRSTDGETARFQLVENDHTLAETTSQIVEPDRTAVVEAEPVAVENDRLVVRVTVHNEGDTPIDGGDVAGESFDVVAPGESVVVTAEVTPPVDRLQVSLAARDDRSVEVGVGTRLTSVAVESGPDGFVDVRVTNHAPCQASDDLRVSGVPTPEQTLTRQVEVAEHGVFVWTIPSLGGGHRVIDAATTTDEDRLETNPGTVGRRRQSPRPASDTGMQSPRQSPPASETKPQSVSEPEPQSASETQPPSDTGAQSPRQSQSASETKPQSVSEPQSPGGETADTRREKSQSGDDPKKPTDDQPVSVERRLETREPTAGETFRERVSVSNDGTEPKSVHIRLDPGELETETTVPPDGEASGERTLVAYDDCTLPPPEVTVGDATITGETAEIEATPGDVTPYVWWTREDGEPYLAVAVSATPGHRGRVNSIEVGGRELGVAAAVSDGETVREAVALPRAPNDETMLATLRCVIDGDSRVLETLCPYLPDVPVVDPVAGLSTAVTAGSAVSDGTGTVYVRIQNDGDRAVDDLQIEAAGGGIDDRWYEPTGVETLEPGEAIEQKLPISTDDAELTATLRLAGGTIRVTGPADPTTDATEAYTVTEPDRATVPQLPSLLVTNR